MNPNDTQILSSPTIEPFFEEWTRQFLLAVQTPLDEKGDNLRFDDEQPGFGSLVRSLDHVSADECSSAYSPSTKLDSGGDALGQSWQATLNHSDGLAVFPPQLSGYFVGGDDDDDDD